MYPFEPARRFHLRVNCGVKKHHARMPSPRPPQIDLLRAFLGRDAAVVEHVAAFFAVIALALRGEHHSAVRERVDLAIFEKRQRVPEDEIDVAFDVAIREVLACRFAWSAVGLAAFAIRVQRVLEAEEADVAEDGAVGGDADRDGLRAFLRERAGLTEGILEREVLGAELVAGYRCAGGFSGPPRRAVAEVVRQNYVGWRLPEPDELDLVLLDRDVFLVEIGRASCRERVLRLV